MRGAINPSADLAVTRVPGGATLGRVFFSCSSRCDDGARLFAGGARFSSRKKTSRGGSEIFLNSTVHHRPRDARTHVRARRRPTGRSERRAVDRAVDSVVKKTIGKVPLFLSVLAFNSRSNSPSLSYTIRDVRSISTCSL